jgi:homeobox-leucine zipper protein
MSNKKKVRYKLVDAQEDILQSYVRKNKPKRHRTNLSEWQTSVLEESFVSNPYPDRAEKYDLFVKTRIPMKSIKIWFQNRRAREKYALEDREVEESRGKDKKLELDLDHNVFHGEFF